MLRKEVSINLINIISYFLGQLAVSPDRNRRVLQEVSTGVSTRTTLNILNLRTKFSSFTAISHLDLYHQRYRLDRFTKSDLFSSVPGQSSARLSPWRGDRRWTFSWNGRVS
jgi:hypothetical protein